MIPLKHDLEPTELTIFKTSSNQSRDVKEFDSIEFQPIKDLIRKKLLDLQNNQCVYCERTFLELREVQVEHIKPKSGRSPYPQLCFTYTNYAGSCIQNIEKIRRTCGQNKGDKILPIEPTNLKCNDFFLLNTEGEIHPLPSLTRRERHPINSTLEILGLNKPHLVLQRKKRIINLIKIIKLDATMADKFIESGNFRFIMRHLVTTPSL